MPEPPAPKPISHQRAEGGGGRLLAFAFPDQDQGNGLDRSKPRRAPSHRLVRFGKTFRNDSDPSSAFDITQYGANQARRVSDLRGKARFAAGAEDLVVEASTLTAGQHDQGLGGETAPGQGFSSGPRMVGRDGCAKPLVAEPQGFHA